MCKDRIADCDMWLHYAVLGVQQRITHRPAGTRSGDNPEKRRTLRARKARIQNRTSHPRLSFKPKPRFLIKAPALVAGTWLSFKGQNPVASRHNCVRRH